MIHNPEKNSIEIYCDGACLGNPGPGGWAVVFTPKTRQQVAQETPSPESYCTNYDIRYLSGYEANTTNNRMELTAAIMALVESESSDIIVYTDSIYVQKGITEWIKTWQNNGWNSGKVKNVDLWQKLLNLTIGRNITWKWIKGHAGNKYNELADYYARLAAKSNNS